MLSRSSSWLTGSVFVCHGTTEQEWFYLARACTSLHRALAQATAATAEMTDLICRLVLQPVRDNVWTTRNLQVQAPPRRVATQSVPVECGCEDTGSVARAARATGLALRISTTSVA